MKFGSLKSNEQKKLRVRAFKAGNFTAVQPYDIPDNALYSSENMWYDKGVLRTREGLSADLKNIIKSENPPLNDTFSYKVSDNSVYINGKHKKIAIEDYCEDDSRYYCNIFFVDADGSSTPAGNFIFSRITDEDFYQPINILFYSGSAVNGAGIFALVSSRNIYNHSQTSYRIYELENSLSSWRELNNFYVPVVYINGRGNRYEESKSAGLAYTGTPKFLESQNMLTDRFKAYYTSDGYSSCFRLPFTDLDNDTVKCRVYKNSTEYTDWLIMEGQSSVTAIFDNLEITLSVDRKKGMLNFTNYAGDYSVPVMSRYHENNICVTAGKTVKNGIENAVSSTCCAVNGSRIVFSGGTDKGRVISVRAENPLYFPCDSSYKIVGEDGINALLNTKNGILAFRKNEIYALALKNGTAINSNSLLADDDSVFYNGDSFTAKRISDNKGLLNKYACLPCGNYILWLGSDRAVYAISISSYEITKLSEAVDGFFDNLSESEVKNVFAVQNGNRYLLLIGGKAVIMDYGNGGLSEPAWYFWSFPNTNVLGGFSSSGELCVFCTGTDGRVFYTAKLSGAEDTDISIKNNAPEIKKQFVPSKAETKSFDFGNMSVKKLIDSISLSAAANSKLEIFINGRRFDSVNLGEPDIDSTCGTLKSVKLLPHLSPVKSLQLKLCSNSAFSLGELVINYRETV